VIDGRGRIGTAPEPNVPPAPLFALIRGASSCAWAVMTCGGIKLVEERADSKTAVAQSGCEKSPNHRGTGENRRGLRLIGQDSILGKYAATAFVRGRSRAGRGVSWKVHGAGGN